MRPPAVAGDSHPRVSPSCEHRARRPWEGNNLDVNGIIMHQYIRSIQQHTKKGQILRVHEVPEVFSHGNNYILVNSEVAGSIRGKLEHPWKARHNTTTTTKKSKVQMFKFETPRLTILPGSRYVPGIKIITYDRRHISWNSRDEKS